MIRHFLQGKTPPLLTRLLGAKHISIGNRTDSMEPEFSHGDIDIADSPPAPNQIKIGDVIAFRHGAYPTPNHYVRHRVIGIERVGDEYRYFTKGDNCPRQDTGFRTYADIFDVVRRSVKFPPILQLFFQKVSDRQTVVWEESVRKWEEYNKAKPTP